MTFTRSGWYNKTKGTTYMMSHEKDENGQVVLSVSEAVRPDIPALFTKYSEEKSPLPTCAEFLNLILNLARGQRSTTPKYQNQFIDRYDKTFFRESAKITFEIDQDSITNMCAFANYIVISRDGKHCGMIAPFYDCYRYLVGNLAYTLHTLVNDKEPSVECPEFELEKRTALKRCHITKTDIRRIRKHFRTLRETASFIEGCMLVCFLRDHATTGKDKSNAKLRNIVRKVAEQIGEVADFEMENGTPLGDTLFSDDIIKLVKEASKCGIQEIWVISAERDEIVDYMAKQYPKPMPMRKRRPAKRKNGTGTSKAKSATTKAKSATASKKTPAKTAAKTTSKASTTTSKASKTAKDAKAEPAKSTKSSKKTSEK